ncbi:MAG: DUF4912 domain-containing protein [Candidatus Firestonebacteria bacterium]
MKLKTKDLRLKTQKVKIKGSVVRKKTTKRANMQKMSREQKILVPIKKRITNVRIKKIKIKKPNKSKNEIKSSILNKDINVENKNFSSLQGEINNTVVVHQHKPLELPNEYNETRIMIIPRDPYCIFAYWEIPQWKTDEAKRQLGEERYQNSKYILRTYDVTDINFTGSNAHRVFDIVLTGLINNWYIDVGIADRNYCVDIGILTKDGYFYLLARSNVVRTPRAGISDVVDEEWALSFEELEKISELGDEFKSSIGSEMLLRKLGKQLQFDISSGGVSSIYSFSGVQAQKQDFFLEVNTELILYGKTIPDAQVTIQSKKIKLNPDGTFSMRFILPDGEQFIPVKAISFDRKDVREIVPVVKKKTK